MLELEQLCRRINMPPEVTEKVLYIDQNSNLSIYHKQMASLLEHSEWEEGLEELKRALADDEGGFIMLTCMLTAGLSTYERYLEKGISEDIFFDTFGCFSRFVREHMVSYKVYGFDRDFWTPRQLAMDLFRLGELEYEFFTNAGKNLISIHIPSDAALTRENCKSSYDMAKEFLAGYYPDYRYEDFICESWLLSPNLKDVLEDTSRVLQFQNEFIIEHFDPEPKDYMEWVFKNPNLTIDEVPQDTSLQRKIKAYIKNGGLIGNAYGHLKPDAFT